MLISSIANHFTFPRTRTLSKKIPSSFPGVEGKYKSSFDRVDGRKYAKGEISVFYQGSQISELTYSVYPSEHDALDTAGAITPAAGRLIAKTLGEKLESYRLWKGIEALHTHAADLERRDYVDSMAQTFFSDNGETPIYRGNSVLWAKLAHDAKNAIFKPWKTARFPTPVEITLLAMQRLQHQHLQQGSQDQAEPLKLLHRALDLAEKTHGTEHPAVTLHLDNLGHYFRDYTDRPERAEALYRRSLAIKERNHGHDAVARATLENLLRTLGRPEDVVAIPSSRDESSSSTQPLIERAKDARDPAERAQILKIAQDEKNDDLLDALAENAHDLSERKALIIAASQLEELPYFLTTFAETSRDAGERKLIRQAAFEHKDGHLLWELSSSALDAQERNELRRLAPKLPNDATVTEVGNHMMQGESSADSLLENLARHAESFKERQKIHETLCKLPKGTGADTVAMLAFNAESLDELRSLALSLHRQEVDDSSYRFAANIIEKRANAFGHSLIALQSDESE